jgi:hypothetical protein
LGIKDDIIPYMGIYHYVKMKKDGVRGYIDPSSLYIGVDKVRDRPLDSKDFVSEWKKKFEKVVLNEKEQNITSRDATEVLQRGKVYKRIGGARSPFSYNLVFIYENDILISINNQKGAAVSIGSTQ